MEGIHGGDIYRNPVTMDFSVNINPLGMPDGVEEALQRAIGQSMKYPDIMADELKTAISVMLSVPKEYLQLGNGASEIFMAIVHAIRPEKTLIPIPSFYGYEYAAKAVSGEIAYFPLKEEAEFMPDEELFDALTEETDLLFLANPNNPTGTLMNRDYLNKLLERCKEKKIYVVLDECFIEFCGTECSALPWIEKYPNLLLVRAFTKIYAIPGVRLGDLICSNRSLLEKIRTQIPEWNLSVFAQEAGVACAGKTAYLEKTVNYVKNEREFLAEGLKKFGFRVFPGEANFLLIHSEKPLYEKLLGKGILIRDCMNFKGLTKGYYRIAVKKRQDNEKLLKAIGECIE